MTKEKKSESQNTGAQFHNLYRPKTLDRVLGQEAVVKRLRGIIDSGRIPSTMLFTGAPSSGKTTLARAFVADLFGVKNLKGHPDFRELNGAVDGNIDNVRALIRMARMRPTRAPRRVFMIDECHGLTGASLEAVLKPLEEPPPYTLWILGTSEPEKLKNSLKTRGSPFAMLPQTREHMITLAKRIVKAEGMDYMTPELIETTVENSNGEMRTLCQLLESIVQTAGSSKKLKKEDILKSLSTVETDDSKTVMNILYGVYSGDMKMVYRHLLDVADGFRMVSLLMSFNTFLINVTVLDGEKHRSVWWNKNNKDLWSAVKELKVSLSQMSVVQSYLLAARARSGSFMTSEQQLIGDAMYRACCELKKLKKKKEPE